MKVTITQINAAKLEAEWSSLAEHIKANQSEFVLLPEMPFSEWFCASKDVDEAIWNASVKKHDEWLPRLPELGARIVAGTAPRNIQGKKYNAAFVWTAETGVQWVHYKTYLPNEPGFWEATWYDRAPIDFQLVSIGDLRIGFMICTEIWFMQHAREHGQKGAHLVLSPRSTPTSTNEKWNNCGRTVGVVSGAYSLSSNHTGEAFGMELGGAGWVSGVEGNVHGTTSKDSPFTTVDVDLAEAESSKKDYPRYVDDSVIE